MKFKFMFTCITISILLIVCGCSQKDQKSQNTDNTKNSTVSKQVINNNSKDLLDAQKVVENYFKYRNEKNAEGLQSTLEEQDPNLSEDIKDTDYIKIISIKEDTDPMLKEMYLYDVKGKAKEAKAANIKVFNVFYDVKYKEGVQATEGNGKNQCWFWVIRKDKNSPWIINDMGQP